MVEGAGADVGACVYLGISQDCLCRLPLSLFEDTLDVITSVDDGEPPPLRLFHASAATDEEFCKRVIEVACFHGTEARHVGVLVSLLHDIVFVLFFVRLR